MSKNKNLLNENTIRRMMKLASVDALSDSFISTKYTPLAESVDEESLEENVEETVEESAPVEETRPIEEVVSEIREILTEPVVENNSSDEFIITLR